MPRRPKRPCSHPFCPNLTDGIYCETHKREVDRFYNKTRRPENTGKRYGRSWKRVRDAYVKEHPYCEWCFEQGVMRPVDEVHHIIATRDGGTDDTHNLVSLCRSCHAKTRKKD